MSFAGAQSNRREDQKEESPTETFRYFKASVIRQSSFLNLIKLTVPRILRLLNCDAVGQGGTELRRKGKREKEKARVFRPINFPHHDNLSACKLVFLNDLFFIFSFSQYRPDNLVVAAAVAAASSVVAASAVVAAVVPAAVYAVAAV